MSLIADALKSAEAERSGAAARAKDTARQLFQGRAQRRAPISGATEWLYRPIRLPQHVRIAGAIVGGAVVLAGAIVFLGPTAPGPVAMPLETEIASALVPAGPTGPVDASLAPEATVNGGEAAPPIPLPSIPGAEPVGPGVAAGGGRDEASAPGTPQSDAGGAASRTAASSASTPAPPLEPLPADAVTRELATPATDAATAPTATEARIEIPTVSTPGQLGGDALRVNARARANSDLFADAVAAQQSRDYASAIVLYRDILALDPEDAEALNNVGVSYQAIGELESARDAFQRALAIEPRYAAAWSNLGVVLGRLGQEADARTALAEAIRQDPGNLGTKVNLALLHQRQGLTQESKRLLQEVLAADATIAEAHFALAGILEAEGSVSSALRHFHQFIATSQGRYPQLEPLVAGRIAALEGRR